jgi:serine/threonine-protein kinase
MTGSTENTLAQLERILVSPGFARADRLKGFLEFIVREALAGRAASLKEYTIGTGVFGKDVTFDPRTDPIVRVQARRLRSKLERYYRADGHADPIVIELPRGGYAPLIRSATAPITTLRPARATLLTRNTVTVLSFADLTATRELASIAAGVREEIIHRLCELATLRVSAAASVGAGDGSDTGTGAENAALVVGGSVRASERGDRVRIHAHLIDSATRTYLWTEVFDGSLADPLEVQERAAIAVAVTLAAGSDAGVGRARPVENLAARAFYTQGRYHLDQRTEESLTRAVSSFERAIGEDAQYAVAHAGLADAYGLLGHYGALAPADVWTRVATMAAMAVALDDQSAEAQTSLAHVRATQDWDWTGAEAGFRRALALDPRYATARHWYAASCLVPLGRLDDALDELTTAQSIDPVSSIIARDLALVHYYRRDHDSALEHCDHAVALNPYFAPAYWALGVVQEQRGDLHESAAAFERAAQLAPRTPRLIAARGRAFALAGRAADAAVALETLDTLAADRYVSPLEVAWVAFALQQDDRAFECVARAFDDRTFDLIASAVDPRFDALRSDSRWRALSVRLAPDR